MKFNVIDKQLTIFLVGRIDSNNVAAIEKEVAAIAADNPDCELIFDADALIYI